MTKGYWIGHIDVQDLESYRPYMAAAASSIAAFGGRYLVRGGKNEVAEGGARSRHVVVEFDSYDKAQACYTSDQYQAAKAMRTPYSTGDIIIIEGHDG